MGILEKVYDRSPIFFQNIMTTVAGYRNKKSRYGKTYYNYREFLKKFDKFPLENKKEIQTSEMIKLVKYVYEKSPFYQRLYKNIDINTIINISDLEKLPIVTKEMLRENINDVITVSESESVESHTGGTTGKSLTVRFTKDDMMKRMAMLDHFKARVGFEHLAMKRATFNGKHIIPPGQKSKIYWRYNHACKQMIYSSFDITEENMKYYIESLNKFKPDAIDGFFMSMVDLASYIERHNVELTFKPIAIFPTSETLTETGRKLLERVFQCNVYDQYASSEGAPFVTECKKQKLHMELSSGVFEHYQNDNDEVLVTSFTTYGTPLIRYQIGDSMIFGDDSSTCSCFNESPIVDSIQGRKLDFLYTAEGGKINGGNAANLFKNIPNAIIRAQLVQNKMDEVTILLEIDKKLYQSKYDKIIEDEFNHIFGEKTAVVIKHVSEISRETSGKFRLIKNNVSELG